MMVCNEHLAQQDEDKGIMPNPTTANYILNLQ